MRIEQHVKQRAAESFVQTHEGGGAGGELQLALVFGSTSALRQADTWR